MTPLGIHHVNITVGDMVGARRFYVEQLGLTERTDRPDFSFDGAWLDLGAQQVHLVVGASAGRSSDHFAILVADIDAAIGELRSFGHRVSEPVLVNGGPARQAFLRDPWENFLELHQPHRSRATELLAADGLRHRELRHDSTRAPDPPL